MKIPKTKETGRVKTSAKKINAEEKMQQQRKTPTKKSQKKEIQVKKMTLIKRDASTLDDAAITFRLCGGNKAPDMIFTLEGTEILDIAYNIFEYLKPHLSSSKETNSLYI